jgi:hypothetical protein
MGTDLTQARTYDPERFRRLVLYLAYRSDGDATFGKTKLAKLLFYSDFLAFAELGKSITGATYAKFPRGPFPRALGSELKTIEDSGDGRIVSSTHFGLYQERLVSLHDVDVSMFSAPEISIVEQVLEALRPYNASDVSRLSHLEPAWQLVPEWDDIPYELVFVAPDPPSQEASDHAMLIAARLGLVNSGTPRSSVA